MQYKSNIYRHFKQSSTKFHLLNGTNINSPRPTKRQCIASTSSPTDTVEIRQAVVQDLPALFHLENTSRPDGNWNFNQIKEELDREHSLVLVSLIDQAIVGWLAAWLVADEMQILEVAVDQNHRRKGIATKLLTTLFTDFRYVLIYPVMFVL